MASCLGRLLATPHLGHLAALSGKIRPLLFRVWLFQFTDLAYIQKKASHFFFLKIISLILIFRLIILNTITTLNKIEYFKIFMSNNQILNKWLVFLCFIPRKVPESTHLENQRVSFICSTIYYDMCLPTHINGHWYS